MAHEADSFIFRARDVERSHNLILSKNSLVFTILYILCQFSIIRSVNAQAEDSIYTVTLSGSYVVPGPGYPGGGAKALVMVSGRLGTLAYWVHGVNTSEPISASLYAGSETEFGPPLIRLLDKETVVRKNAFGEAGYSFYGTQRLDLKFAEFLTQQPQNYYIQLSTSDRPKGACRGQLSSNRGTVSINIGA